MGKLRKFRIFGTDAEVAGVRPIGGTISRDQLKQNIEDTFGADQFTPADEMEELRAMAETVEYIGWGHWSSWIVDETKGPEPQRCGCPLASISDWVDDNSQHPGQSPTGRFARFDHLMSRQGYATHLKVV